LRLNGSSVGWSSRRQRTVARSTTEAEYAALWEGLSETLWIQQLLNDMGFEVNLPTTIWEDNEPAEKIAKNRTGPSRIKHMDVTVGLIQDYQDDGLIDVKRKETEN